MSSGKDEPSGDVIESIGFVCLTCLCAAAGMVFATDTIGTSARRAAFEIDDTINPNDASSASLARLPRIGLARARDIVFYRNQFSGRVDLQPVFSRAEDLRRITGIGPVTVGAVRPWLSFDSNAPDELDIPGRRP